MNTVLNEKEGMRLNIEILKMNIIPIHRMSTKITDIDKVVIDTVIVMVMMMEIDTDSIITDQITTKHEMQITPHRVMIMKKKEIR